MPVTIAAAISDFGTSSSVLVMGLIFPFAKVVAFLWPVWSVADYTSTKASGMGLPSVSMVMPLMMPY